MSEARLGVAEWFEPGAYDRVERVLERLRAMDIGSLRLGIRWSDAHRSENDRWFEWLLRRTAMEVDVTPCLVHAPPDLLDDGLIRDPDAFAAFLDRFTTRHGDRFEWLEIWDEPNDAAHWDHTRDPGWDTFARMARSAAALLRSRGKKTVLGGMRPADPHWLERMFDSGLMDSIDAVGMAASDSTRDAVRVQEVLDRHEHKAEIWITKTAAVEDELAQVRTLRDALRAPVQRVYFAAMDAPPSARTECTSLWDNGDPRLLARLLMDGRSPATLDWAVQEAALAAGPGHIVVTGGAGFVGANLTDRLLREGHEVLILDNLSRRGSLENLERLREIHGNALHARVADVRDRRAVEAAIAGASAVFHLAAQVAVTTSLHDPRGDFETNAAGTLNVLEAVRAHAPGAFLLYASTNKVYGAMDDVRFIERPRRYEVQGRPGRTISFATPYGCSKGAADQYVLDYARTFNLQATVFRMSCIYGPWQNGTEDQGWVAHFLRSGQDGRTVTIYGDGKQVRDMLHVDDLVEAYLRAMRSPAEVVGRAWDVGGGPHNTSSLLELLDTMAKVGHPVPPVRHDVPRLSDQLHYVSDIAPLSDALGWTPRITIEEGLARLARARQVVA